MRVGAIVCMQSSRVENARQQKRGNGRPEELASRVEVPSDEHISWRDEKTAQSRDEQLKAQSVSGCRDCATHNQVQNVDSQVSLDAERDKSQRALVAMRVVMFIVFRVSGDVASDGRRSFRPAAENVITRSTIANCATATTDAGPARSEKEKNAIEVSQSDTFLQISCRIINGLRN